MPISCCWDNSEALLIRYPFGHIPNCRGFRAKTLTSISAVFQIDSRGSRANALTPISAVFQ